MLFLLRPVRAQATQMLSKRQPVWAHGPTIEITQVPDTRDTVSAIERNEATCIETGHRKKLRESAPGSQVILV